MKNCRIIGKEHRTTFGRLLRELMDIRKVCRHRMHQRIDFKVSDLHNWPLSKPPRLTLWLFSVFGTPKQINSQRYLAPECRYRETDFTVVFHSWRPTRIIVYKRILGTLLELYSWIFLKCNSAKSAHISLFGVRILRWLPDGILSGGERRDKSLNMSHNCNYNLIKSCRTVDFWTSSSWADGHP